MSAIEVTEKFVVRFVAPALALVAAVSGFILTFDFQELRGQYPNWPGFFNLLEHYWMFWVFIFASIFLFFSNLFLAKISPTREELRSALHDKGEELEKITDHVSFCLEGFIWEQAKRVGFEEHGVSRISLYLHEPERSRFFLLVRKSHNYELQKKGRTFFDDDKGCIALAWQRDWHFDNDFPDDRDKAADYHKEKYKIDKKIFAGLTMKPRLLAAKRVVDKDDRPLALIVIESEKSDAFEEKQLRGAMVEAAKDCANLLIAWANHLPAPSLAQDEGL